MLGMWTSKYQAHLCVLTLKNIALTVYRGVVHSTQSFHSTLLKDTLRLHL